MPIKYFDTFPKIDYSMKDGDVPAKVTDITRRVGIRKDFTNLISSYYKQNLQSAERPEVLSDMVYDSSAYHWVLMHINNVVDPYHDWIIDYNTLEEYVQARYPNRTIDVRVKDSMVHSGVNGYVESLSELLPNVGERIYSTVNTTEYVFFDWTGGYATEQETGITGYVWDVANQVSENKISIINIEESGEYKISSAEYIMNQI